MPDDCCFMFFAILSNYLRSDNRYLDAVSFSSTFNADLILWR